MNRLTNKMRVYTLLVTITLVAGIAYPISLVAPSTTLTQNQADTLRSPTGPTGPIPVQQWYTPDRYFYYWPYAELKDFDGDGGLEILTFSYQRDTVYFLNAATGQEEWSFGPLEEGYCNIGLAVSVADMDSDGKLDVILFVWEPVGGQHLRCYSQTGQLMWDYTSPSRWFMLVDRVPPAIADVDSNGELELIAALWGSGLLFCLNSHGELMWLFGGYPGDVYGFPGWPVIGDFNGDERLEVIVGNWGSPKQVFCLDAATGASIRNYTTEINMANTDLTIRDIDSDGISEILVASANANGFGTLYCLDGETWEQKWSYTPPATSQSYSAIYGPTIADVDSDAQLELLFGGYDNTLYCLNNHGELKWTASDLSGWPGPPYPPPNFGKPTVADVSGDNQPEILVGSFYGYLHCFSGSGKLEWNYFHWNRVSTWPPVISDVDGDGRQEMIVSTWTPGGTCCIELSWPGDTTPPVTSASLSGDLGLGDWYKSPVTVTLTATDDYSGVAKTLYSINGGPWGLYGGPFTIENEGITSISFKSIDRAGNEEQPKSIEVKVDTRAPTTELVFTPQYTDTLGNIYVTSGTSFTLTAMDPTPGSGLYGTYYTINGVQKQYDGAFSLPGPDGAYTISYWSNDTAGNAETPKTVTVNLVSLEVDSHVSQGVSGPTLTFFDVVFTKDKPDGYKLVSTNPGEFFYIVEATNTWPITIGTLTIDLEIPVDFGLKGADPITVYLDGSDITGLCTITGTTITVADVPAGSTVQVIVHLDYALKGTHYPSLSDFMMKCYVFSASISGSDGLLGTYVTSWDLVAHQKKTTAIAGYVKDVNGNPMVGVTVELVDSAGSVRYAVTDENGFYFFMDLAAGDYQVIVWYSGEVYTATVNVQEEQLAQVDIRTS